ncbi:unnamed protein product [Mytilus coruscus]|uniref:Uncharacterized protein n=1 Tax=Mytilus coruscus TaxID=42192 RepID=A0A6J8ECH9_MYTCO|nr:unnamed protein product [Mytilus coruscus]
MNKSEVSNCNYRCPDLTMNMTCGNVAHAYLDQYKHNLDLKVLGEEDRRKACTILKRNRDSRVFFHAASCSDKYRLFCHLPGAIEKLKKFYDPQDRPTNNVDVPTDDEMSDDEDNEEENAEDADEIVQTDTQPDSNDPIRNDTQVQRHTNDDRNNDDSDLYLVERIVKAKTYKQ